MATPLKPIKWYKELNTKKWRLQHKAFLLEGSRAISLITKNKPQEIIEILSTKPLPTSYKQFPFRIITENQLLSISSAKTPQGIIAVVKLPEEILLSTLPDEPGSKILLLENVQDPGNVGTLIRTAAAFGYGGVILTEGCADPFSPKSIQSSAGSMLSIWVRKTADHIEMIKKLKSAGFSLLAMDLEGSKNTEALKREKIILALGNEGAGLSDKLLECADYRIKLELKQSGAESLNVAACGAICMYVSSD